MTFSFDVSTISTFSPARSFSLECIEINEPAWCRQTGLMWSSHLSSSDRPTVFSKNCQLHWDFLFSLIGFSRRSARVKFCPLSTLTSTLAMPRPPPPQAIPLTVIVLPGGNISGYSSPPSLQHFSVQSTTAQIRDQLAHIIIERSLDLSYGRSP